MLKVCKVKLNCLQKYKTNSMLKSLNCVPAKVYPLAITPRHVSLKEILCKGGFSHLNFSTFTFRYLDLDWWDIISLHLYHIHFYNFTFKAYIYLKFLIELFTCKHNLFTAMIFSPRYNNSIIFEWKIGPRKFLNDTRNIE